MSCWRHFACRSCHHAFRVLAASFIVLIVASGIPTAAARPAPRDTSPIAATVSARRSRTLKQSEDAVLNRVIFDTGDEDYLFTTFLGKVAVAEAEPFVAAAGAAVSPI
jgi:hypothetical protein